jgi:PAS domain S-box-containing protein
MPKTSSPTILFVDDDKRNRESYGLIFREAGFAVQEAATGDEALRLASQNPDLVVLDVNLPDMNGYEVCRRIKMHPATNAIPVLHLSTVFTRSEERTQSLEQGADGYLVKPVEPEELLAHVKALLRVRQAEDQLREAARQWQTTFDATSDSVCLLDAAGKIQRCNRALADLLRLPLSAILGRPYQPLIQAALAPSLLPDLTYVQQTGRRANVELNQAGRWFHITADPVTDECGRINGSVHIFADITEFKKVDEERNRLLADRAKLAEHLRLLLESTGEGIYGIDGHGRCTFVNRAAADMFGVTPDQLVGENVHARVHHSHVDSTTYPEGECPILQAMVAGQGCRIDSEVFWRNDGTWFPVEYSAHPVRNRAGDICGAVVTFTDITSRKQMEQRLIHSQKMEAIGRLAGGIAHDFNNLMSVVLGNSTILLSQVPQSQAQRETLLAIDQAAWRATELTRRLVGFSRQSRLWLRPTDLRLAVDETTALLSRTIDPRITIEVASAPDLWPVEADLGQLNQVLMNLCLNARDAMPEGGRLSVLADNVVLNEKSAQFQVSEARAGEFVRLRVADTGYGIPAEILPQIFEPFFTTKEIGKGTGLGLAMVFGIVKQHQGWITCTSAPGSGARFDIYLPRTKSQPSPGPAAAAPATSLVGEETILVVDDEPLLRDVSRKILEDRGFHVLVAADGLQAVEIFRQHQDEIDLIVLDLTMPHLSGRDTLRNLREIHRDVAVVYVTGYAAKLAEAGIDRVRGLLPKPFRPDELVKAVRAALDAEQP